MYDKENIFAKIIRNELPSDKIYEDDYLVAFNDKFPISPIHILVIPKGEYENYEDFTTNASFEEIGHFFKTVGEIAKKYSKNGEFKIVSNAGKSVGQTVFHFHIHILSGKEFKNHI